jgi:hypothetical protein
MNVDGVDSVVRSVLEKFVARSRFGREKYGTDLDRTDLAVTDWITHAQEELMDGILYLEKLRGCVAPPIPQGGGTTPYTPSLNSSPVESTSGGMVEPTPAPAPEDKFDEYIHTFTT